MFLTFSTLVQHDSLHTDPQKSKYHKEGLCKIEPGCNSFSMFNKENMPEAQILYSVTSMKSLKKQSDVKKVIINSRGKNQAASRLGLNLCWTGPLK